MFPPLLRRREQLVNGLVNVIVAAVIACALMCARSNVARTALLRVVVAVLDVSSALLLLRGNDIYAGIDVGGAHYSLTEHDQTELMAQFQTVKEGAKEVPYHADGELCRMYTAEEFTALTQAATAHVFYHRTYCNHLNAWIKRAGLDEIPAIVYGADLPADLAASMAALIEKAGGDA